MTRRPLFRFISLGFSYQFDNPTLEAILTGGLLNGSAKFVKEEASRKPDFILHEIKIQTSYTALKDPGPIYKGVVQR